MNGKIDISIVPGAGAVDDLLVKLLGPSAEYLGSRIRAHFENGRAEENMTRVLSKAIRKAGSTVGDGKSVPPRVIKMLLEEAPYCEDEIMAEYIGGVLAASRGARSDRNISYLATISRLSTVSLGLHFVLYRAFVEVQRENKEHFGKIIVPWIDIFYALFYDNLKNQDDAEDRSITEHADWCRDEFIHAERSLERENLAEIGVFCASSLKLGYGQKSENPAVLFAPTALGGQLFAASHGREVHSAIIDDDSIEYDESLPELTSARASSKWESQVLSLQREGLDLEDAKAMANEFVTEQENNE